MRFNIVTLGCKVNSYESNYIRDLFLNEGYIEDQDNPDVIVINTCTVTDTSDSKSLKIIRSNMRKYENSIFVVIGCFAQLNSNILKGMNVNITRLRYCLSVFTGINCIKKVTIKTIKYTFIILFIVF